MAPTDYERLVAKPPKRWSPLHLNGEEVTTSFGSMWSPLVELAFNSIKPSLFLEKADLQAHNELVDLLFSKDLYTFVNL